MMIGDNMKRRLAGLIAASWLLAFPSLAQDENESIREKVETVNVEVPVRVYSSGKPVTDLKKEDFTLFEDGRTQVINGFVLSRKKIDRLPEPAPGTGLVAPSRYFVLSFRVYDFNEPLRQGLAHLFASILRPQDQLLVFANNKTRFYVRLQEKERILAEIEDDLRKQCHIAKNNMLISLKEVEDEGNKLKWNLKNASMIGSMTAPGTLTVFLKKYGDILNEYKRRYLSQDIYVYYNLARHLARINKEKWVINFYQLEMFPQMTDNKEVRQLVERYIEAFRASDVAENRAGAISLSRTLQEIDKNMNISGEFSAKDISKLFYKVNASFHSVFIKSRVDALSENIEFKRMATSIEDNLRELTKKTGGSLIVSGDIVDSLDVISGSEDSVYLLTYVPLNPAKIGKIKVEVAGKGYDVLYDDNQRADYISAYLRRKQEENPSLMFGKFSFRNKKLSLDLTRFKMQDIGGKACGKLTVHVQVVASSGQSVFDRSRNLEALKDPVSLSLGFDFLAPGKYDVVVEAQDLLSGKSYTDFLQPVIQ